MGHASPRMFMGRAMLGLAGWGSAQQNKPYDVITLQGEKIIRIRHQDKDRDSAMNVTNGSSFFHGIYMQDTHPKKFSRVPSS